MTSVLNPGLEVTKMIVATKADGKTNDPATPTASTTKKSNGKRKSASLPSETVEYLKAWMMSPEHIAHPYPTEQEKVEIMKDTKIELKQLTNWFVNNRKRYWKPRVEARLQQQAQAAQAAVQAHAAAVAAVSAANSLPQQQQMVATSSSEITRANLVSPSVVGFKYSAQSSLPSQASNPPLMTFNQSPIPSFGVQEQVFASSPLAFAAQIVEQSRKQTVSVPATSSGVPVNMNATTLSSAASVSASEGEISDCGNTSDDASSDGATILGTNLKFIDRKTKTLKPRTSTISLSSLLPERPRQTINVKTRNISFCSLDKISSEAASPSASHVFEAESSANEKKRSFVPSEEKGFQFVVTMPSSKSHLPSERKRFRTVSVDIWRKKCQDATHLDDDTLPSLEEASRLFGFTSA
mmetsp:Transcript_6864/g.16826  ORF Transcript_6864/g.16826 Transcript_6864/m.16826 type:complete len:410 (-) Transcript_6864:6213-7442(-)